MPTAAGSDREALFLSQLDLVDGVIAFVCARHHLRAADADDFGSYVKLKFVENDYALLSKFEGRSSLRTFLTVVIQRLFLDYRIAAWGKWRPSADAKRAGTVAVLLEQLIVRDAHSLDEACEMLRSNHNVTATRADLERLAARLPARTRRRFESDETLAALPANDRPLDDVAAGRDRRAAADRIAEVMPSLMARLVPEDRLLLALRFEDGRTVAEIAAILRLDQKALYRRLARLLGELRKGLETAGIDNRAVREIFESPDVNIEWSEPTNPEKLMTRPSMREGAQ
jgi:RNA polymerase sigma factor (sigma-70 family)